MKTVNPRSTTRRANSATLGVMPGISAITITAGPSPADVDRPLLPAEVERLDA